MQASLKLLHLVMLFPWRRTGFQALSSAEVRKGFGGGEFPKRRKRSRENKKL